MGSLRLARALVAALGCAGVLHGVAVSPVAAESAPIPAGGVLRVDVPEAIGGKTVIGQLTVDQVTERGFVTAYACADGIPRNSDGTISRSDLNYDGAVRPVQSNRLIVEADDDGDVCFYTARPAALIVDINAVTFDTGITSFPNQRTDTRTRPIRRIDAGSTLTVNLPEAIGGKTVIGQLTVDQVTERGFVTAYACADGIPRNSDGTISRSDLNYDGAVRPVQSNRLIVEADTNGDVCFHTSATAALIVDINGVSDTGITSFPNQRTDTRGSTGNLPSGAVTVDDVPVWPPYDVAPPLVGVAALTGLPAGPAVTERPILAVKIDNYRRARPQWALDQADAVIEENVEGISRFVALFHTQTPTVVGPVRSARTGDLDLLAAMNRPVFAYSGANPGVDAWLTSAATSGVLVDFSAQRRPCFERSLDKPGPHNLVLDIGCVLAEVTAGPARRLWQHDRAWQPPASAATTTDGAFAVPMDGVYVEWTWDAGSGTYLRSQDGEPHVSEAGARIEAHNVVELVSTHVPSPVDARSPNPITTGTGAAVVHRDGVAVEVTWSRPTPYDSFTFIEPRSGLEVPLDVGTTFVQLVRER